LKWLPATENLGYGGGANYGWSKFSGEICIVLNPDMSFPVGWLEKFIAPFTKDAKIGVVGCKLLYENGTMQHAGGIVKHGAALIETFGQGEPDDGRWDESGEAEFVTGAALAVRREIVDQLGGFDPEFFPGYFEDVDLCYRARQQGWRIWYEGGATAYHYEGRAFGRSAAYFEAFHRNRLRFILKHYPARRVFEEFLPAERARLMATTEPADRIAAFSVYQSARQSFTQSNPVTINPGGSMTTLPTPNPQPQTPAEISRQTERMAVVQQRWLVEEKPFSSRLPFVAAIRERINSLSTKWYVKPILAQQVEYNAAVSRALEDLGTVVTGKVIADDLESAALASRLANLEERLDRIEGLLQKLIEKESHG
jgi:hypothetical protein